MGQIVCPQYGSRLLMLHSLCPNSTAKISEQGHPQLAVPGQRCKPSQVLKALLYEISLAPWLWGEPVPGLSLSHTGRRPPLWCALE